MVQGEEPPPLFAIAPDVPPAVAGAVMRALAKDPSARPRSAREFASQLAAPDGSRPAGWPWGKRRSAAAA